MSKETYAQIMRESFEEWHTRERRRAYINASFVGMVESIVNDADYTAARKIAKLRNLNDARKEVLADE